ncbi:MAG: peptidoglycan-binding protein [Candidatus Tectomicrobia bacterium]|uniref:Peptidoglycan-binding protein n=1 Tax=Tectimicrobiota bacterium TaxID=2528274 RepID=A0A938B0E4_UNCTE|nr:peptidoglycan-binding protein [Candidatus Tectomicrobia bacterium]
MDDDSLSNRTPELLQHGSESEAVKALQTRLRALGFSPGELDGIFGDNTRAAVIAFQRSRGLDDDGKVGRLTREALAS